MKIEHLMMISRGMRNILTSLSGEIVVGLIAAAVFSYMVLSSARVYG